VTLDVASAEAELLQPHTPLQPLPHLQGKVRQQVVVAHSQHRKAGAGEDDCGDSSRELVVGKVELDQARVRGGKCVERQPHPHRAPITHVVERNVKTDERRVVWELEVAGDIVAAVFP
jgi:hypothetical protein